MWGDVVETLQAAPPGLGAVLAVALVPEEAAKGGDQALPPLRAQG
jgi:hypothetical protein